MRRITDIADSDMARCSPRIRALAVAVSRGQKANSGGFHEISIHSCVRSRLPRAHRASTSRASKPDEVVDVNLMKGAQQGEVEQQLNPTCASALIDVADRSLVLNSWRSSTISTRRIRNRRCCRAQARLGFRARGELHTSLPVIHTAGSSTRA